MAYGIKTSDISILSLWKRRFPQFDKPYP